MTTPTRPRGVRRVVRRLFPREIGLTRVVPVLGDYPVTDLRR